VIGELISARDRIVQSVVNLTITKTGPPTSSQSQQEKYTIKVKNEKGSDRPGKRHAASRCTIRCRWG
jgi:hypothetical protein